MQDSGYTLQSVTCLPGRKALIDRLHETGRFGTSLTAALHIDVCNFDILNLLCGPAAGDALLAQVGTKLQARLPESARVAHLWSDEFLVVFPADSPATALSQVEALRAALSELPLPGAARELPFRASYGVAIVPDAPDWDELLNRAQYACREARRLGTNQIHLQMAGDNGVRASIETGARLSQMIRERQLVLHAQPIFQVGPGEQQRVSKVEILLLHAQPIFQVGPGEQQRVSKVEILLRRKTADGGVPIPQGFIEVGERLGFVRALDQFVLEETLAWFREHPVVLQRLDRVAINLSGHTLSDRSFHDLLLQKVCLGGVPARKLCFEITETSLVANLAQVRGLITELTSLGCSVALDDFGIGLCSFGYLQELPVDEVKIDGSFIRRMGSDPAAVRIVEALVTVAQATGKRTLAEFVEDAATVQHLRRLGVPYMQGWLFAKAMPLDQLAGFIERSNQTATAPSRARSLAA